MASLGGLPGSLSELKDGKFDLGSSSFQRTVIDAVNLVFSFIFYLLVLLSVCSSERNHSRCRRRDWFSVVVSICCVLLSIVYFTFASWDTLSWQVYLFRGMVWFSLAVSLMVQRFKWIRVLVPIWYATFLTLVSALDIELLLRRDIQLLDILQFPVNALLFVCAMRLLKVPIEHTSTDAQSEPLLSEKSQRPQAAELNSSILTRLNISWINPLLRLGYSKPLELEDIPSLFSEDEAYAAYNKFSNTWDSLTNREIPKGEEKDLVTSVLLRVYKKELLLVGGIAFVRTITVVASPLLLYAFVRYSNNNERNLHQGLILLGYLVMVKMIESLSQRQWAFYARRTGMRIRSALMVAVYRKQLNLTVLGKRKHSTGEIVNYIMVDAYRMGEVGWYFHSAWSLPLQLMISLGVLIWVVGLGALLALTPLIICGALNFPFARRLQECQMKSMQAQDTRLRATSEVLNSMKIIKLQSWEDHFLKFISSLRECEFKWLRDAQHNIANCTALFWFSPTVISSFAFWGCTLFRSAPLDAVTMFTILATLAIVAEPVVMLPNVFSSMIQIMVSFDRINKFLVDDELRAEAINGNPLVNQETKIEIWGGNFSWEPESEMLNLRDIDLEVQRREKTAVCGPVGSGKSSLLYAMLGEIPKVSGHVDVCGSIAYVSQSAWIQSGTVRDNILYGQPMDKDRYEKAIRACALDKDISNFSNADLTEIGQRGINLSGGQKQRIQLARAVYSDADIYLLDDPFSAVDAHTAAILFNDCVMDALDSKTVILVTHQVEFLSQVDKILVMENGQVTQSGSYQELLMVGTAFEQLVSAHKTSVTQLGASCSETNTETPVDQQTVYTVSTDKESDIPMKLTSGQLTEEEEKEVGDYGWKPYLDYFTVSKSRTALCLSVVSQCGFVAFQAASRYWLAFAIAIPKISSGILISVYAGVSTLGIVFVHLRSLFTVHFGLKASEAFFEGFMNSVFRAPMLFFDSTPVGRILTRASSDLTVLDFDIPFGISYVLAGAIELIGILLVMSLVTWQVLVVGILTLIAAKYFQDRYLASAREIIRINGTTKAPIMNFAAETSQGVVTIRAFKKGDQFFRNYLKLVDTDAKLFFYSNASIEWLLLRIDALQNITLFATAFLFILLPKDYVPPGFVGLSLSYALGLKGTHAFMAQFYCNISNFIVSVERIKQFMHIEPEPKAIIDENRPPSTWPSKGRIELQDLKIKYQPSAPLVLKGITCVFEEGKRVGVVGRTGSGKTTLISALFRLVEPHSGRICIDGIDICSIGLKDLRTKLSIIPQEPTLFRGSIRSNLDPLGLYSDAEIWEALEKCQLKLTVSGLLEQLDSSVGDEGENWSMGQRQLFCLGRVLLKRNKILVLDEATASIDTATDAILQRIIREEFSDCTVITVAHRVPTVIDSDMVMVLSYGELVEYGEPSELLQSSSSFTKLVAEYWSSCRRSSSSKLGHF